MGDTFKQSNIRVVGVQGGRERKEPRKTQKIMASAFIDINTFHVYSKTIIYTSRKLNKPKRTHSEREPQTHSTVKLLKVTRKETIWKQQEEDSPSRTRKF